MYCESTKETNKLFLIADLLGGFADSIIFFQVDMAGVFGVDSSSTTTACWACVYMS